MKEAQSDIGLIGLAVMGQNLALNIADHGFQVTAYNRTTEKTDKFVAEHPDTGAETAASLPITPGRTHALDLAFSD